MAVKCSAEFTTYCLPTASKSTAGYRAEAGYDRGAGIGCPYVELVAIMELTTPLGFALAYAGAGYRVIPCHGKIPLTGHGAHDASRDEAVIAGWWHRWPNANIGLTLDGLVAVDIDPRNGGDVENLLQPLPDTCYARTGGGGWHYLYRAHNGTGYPGKLDIGIDVKHGAGNYIIVEPSIHASGERYCWLDESEPWTTKPADAPAWLARPTTKATSAHENGIGEGGRNAHLTSLAGTMQRRGMTPAAILAALRAENAERCSPPLADEEVARIAASVSRYAPADADVSAPRFTLLTTEEVMNAPPLQWLVRGVLPATGLACIYGASSSGKSFLALDMSAAIAAGVAWFGGRVKAAPVVYVALEGEAGFSQRVKAWRLHHGQDMPPELHFILQGFDLRHGGDVAEIAAAVTASGCAGGVLIIDTLNRAASGADENTSRDMGELIDACKRLQAELSGLVVMVHHSGKDQTKGLRGHSSLYAALDAAIEVTRNGDRREWAIDKAKDGSDGERRAFKLQRVEIGTDEDGEPVTSCAVVPDDAPADSRRLKLPQGSTQKIVYEAVGALLRKGEHLGKAGAPASRPCVQIEAAVLASADRLTCREDQRVFQARRAINAMVANGVFQTSEGWLWHF